jgi:hypothetical protein
MRAAMLSAKPGFIGLSRQGHVCFMLCGEHSPILLTIATQHGFEIKK